jgi:transposase-like protein
MKQKGLKGSKEGRTPLYDESLKIIVAREYLTGQSSYTQLAGKYNLEKAATVRHFVKWYHAQLDSKEQLNATQPGISLQASDLQQQLAQANLRITALEMLIQNAEKELGVDIKKKYGTKQPSK